MCIVLYITLLKVVSHYNLVFCPCHWWVSKQVWICGGWVDRWGELYPVFVWYFVNFAKPQHTIHSYVKLACLTAICQPGLCPGKQTCTVIEGEAVCSCKCSGSGCNNAGTVCGSNGQSYDSQAALILAACRSGKDIDLDYYGECQGGYYNRSVAQIL